MRRAIVRLRRYIARLLLTLAYHLTTTTSARSYVGLALYRMERDPR